MTGAHRLIEYVRPNGPETDEVDCASVIHDLESRGAEFWESGSTDAGLNLFEHGVKVAEVVILKRQGLGIVLLFTKFSEKEQYALVEPDNGDEEVTIDFVGSDWPLPKRMFVSFKIASIALQHFATHGERSPQVIWEVYLA